MNSVRDFILVLEEPKTFSRILRKFLNLLKISKYNLLFLLSYKTDVAASRFLFFYNFQIFFDLKMFNASNICPISVDFCLKLEFFMLSGFFLFSTNLLGLNVQLTLN